MSNRSEFLGNKHIKAREDGSIVQVDLERVAIRVGAGEDFHDAWTQIGEKHRTPDQRRYRNQLARSPVYQNRVKMIKDEKAETEAAADAGDEWAEALFMVRQFYREVFALGDAPRIQKAVEMRMEIARQRAAARGPALATPQPAAFAEEPAEEVESKGPGRPATKDPAAERQIDDIRQALLKKGVKTPTALAK